MGKDCWGPLGNCRKPLSPDVYVSLCSFLRWGLVSSENKEAGPRPGLLVFYSAIFLSGTPASLDQEKDHWRGIWELKSYRTLEECAKNSLGISQVYMKKTKKMRRNARCWASFASPRWSRGDRVLFPKALQSCFQSSLPKATCN